MMYSVEEAILPTGVSRCRILNDGQAVMLNDSQELTFLRLDDAVVFAAAMNLGVWNSGVWADSRPKVVKVQPPQVSDQSHWLRKYAIADAADQTIIYLAKGVTSGCHQDDVRAWTTKHPEAFLFVTEDEAKKIVANLTTAWIETVNDEAEFRARPDTWNAEPARSIVQQVYDLLVKEASAIEHWRDAFVQWFEAHETGEYRFQGNLGFGGKFWKNSYKWYITCYREDETPERLGRILLVDTELNKLRDKARHGHGHGQTSHEV